MSDWSRSCEGGDYCAGDESKRETCALIECTTTIAAITNGDVMPQDHWLVTVATERAGSPGSLAIDQDRNSWLPTLEGNREQWIQVDFQSTVTVYRAILFGR